MDWTLFGSPLAPLRLPFGSSLASMVCRLRPVVSCSLSRNCWPVLVVVVVVVVVVVKIFVVIGVVWVVVVVVIVVFNCWLFIFCFNFIADRYTKIFKTFQKLNALPVPCYAGLVKTSRRGNVHEQGAKLEPTWLPIWNQNDSLGAPWADLVIWEGLGRRSFFGSFLKLVRGPKKSMVSTLGGAKGPPRSPQLMAASRGIVRVLKK